jgi:disulfide bond formation protein DsbB
LRRLLLVLVITAIIATAFVSAALAQRPREDAPPSPSVGASAASDPNAAASMGAAGSVAPSAATSPGATADTNGALLGWATALALVVGGFVALRLVVRRGPS